MRHLYSLLYCILIPLVLLRLWWRGRKLPAYRLRWRERFGLFEFKSEKKPVIWLHTVSVGEFIAAKAVINWLLQLQTYQLVVTTTTPTGSEQVQKAFPDTVFHVYAPNDLPGCVKSFLHKTKPVLAIFMETELWPNKLHYCRAFGVKTLLANGRLSKKSAAGYNRIAKLTKSMLDTLDHAAIQNSADAQRFIELGLGENKIDVIGSIKFDLEISETVKASATQLKKEIHADRARKVLIAASTHKGEEEIILAAFTKFKQVISNSLLILVPRHPDRFENVYQLCQQNNFRTIRRSKNESVNHSTEILLGDTLGELLMLYGAADIAFVGGSLVENGGHNYLEPAAWGLPIISGPSTYNFSEITDLLKSTNSVVIVKDTDALTETVIELFNDNDKRVEMGDAAVGVVRENRGALGRLIGIINVMLEG